MRVEIVLRAAEENDLASVGLIHQRSRAHAYAHLLAAETLDRTTAEGMAAYWTERWTWERDTNQLTVAGRDGHIVGFTYVGPSDTEGAVELYALHVHPDVEGTGVGRTLMLDALQRLEKIAPLPPGETTPLSAGEIGASEIGASEIGASPADDDDKKGGGDKRAVLWVLAGNDHARRFYAKGGWSPDGATREGPINGESILQLRYSRPLPG